MDSSSIVSFNNDSTYQSTLKGDNNFNVHELALHAMRDRCLLLQRRINALESDNIKLKLDVTKANETSYTPLRDDVKFALQQKIVELSKQKSQLMHHVLMVSCENKNLWSKLAALNAPGKSVKERIKQPLIRTNTYIHSTPKPNMQYQEKYAESSLEEISLKVINSFIQEKSQLVEQYEQMTQLQDLEDDCVLNVDSIGFNFIEDPATDSLKEIKSQTEKLLSLQKEVSQQEKDIQFVISKLEALLNDGYQCPTCRLNRSQAVETEDKSTEITSSLVNFATQTDSMLFENLSDINTTSASNKPDHSEDNNIYDKICPICSETFLEEIEFADFQSHVENHFIGAAEEDSLENIDNQNSYDNII